MNICFNIFFSNKIFCILFIHYSTFIFTFLKNQTRKDISNANKLFWTDFWMARDYFMIILLRKFCFLIFNTTFENWIHLKRLRKKFIGKIRGKIHSVLFVCKHIINCDHFSCFEMSDSLLLIAITFLNLYKFIRLFSFLLIFFYFNIQEELISNCLN